MIGNDRLYRAVKLLAASEGDVRSRVCCAMSTITPLMESEFYNRPDLWKRIKILRRETDKKGPQIIKGEVLKNTYENTAFNRKNSTYSKYAKEIFDIWLETCRE